MFGGWNYSYDWVVYITNNYLFISATSALMIEILATLSASAAAGMRIGIPLLIIGLLQGSNLWSQVPILSHISHQYC